MPLPTGSAIERAMACVASAVLPKVDTVNELATKGKEKHAFFANALKLGREKALDLVPDEYRELCAVVDVDSLPQGAEFQAEVAFVYNVDTEGVRFLGFDVGRNYGFVGHNEIAMSIDILGLAVDEVFVVDAKTGYGKVPRASNNWQLRVGALAAARWRGVDRARVALAYVRDNGQPYYDVAELDAMDLSMIAEDLRQLKHRIANQQISDPAALKYATGDHCKYCPSLPYCYAQTAMVRRLAGDAETVGKDILALLTPETAAKAHERLKAVKEVLKRVDAALYAYASQTPIVLADGSVFGPVEKSVEEIDADVAREVLKKTWGIEEADAACSFETSKAGIERAARAYAVKQGGTIKAAKEAMLEAIRVAGGVLVKKRTEVREHQP